MPVQHHGPTRSRCRSIVHLIHRDEHTLCEIVHKKVICLGMVTVNLMTFIYCVTYFVFISLHAIDVYILDKSAWTLMTYLCA